MYMWVCAASMFEWSGFPLILNSSVLFPQQFLDFPQQSEILTRYFNDLVADMTHLKSVIVELNQCNSEAWEF